MIKNYLLVTMRNLAKYPGYTFINIFGLAIGITCFLLIILWVKHELSFDRFIPKYKKLYQVWVNFESGGEIQTWSSIPLATYPTLKQIDQNIVNTCVLDNGSVHLIDNGSKKISQNGYWASEEFLTMFEFPILQGDRATSLHDPYSIVITEDFAKTLFDNQDPLNKILRIDNETNVKVTGVLKNIPSNSSFQFKFLLPYNLRKILSEQVRRNETQWSNYSYQVFIELDEQSSYELVQENVRPLLTGRLNDVINREVMIYPMERWRLYSNFMNGVEKGGLIDYVKIFTIVAFLILIVACINYINLATARSERRAREIGIRKAVGSLKTSIIGLFLGESFIITTSAFIMALIASIILLPYYSDIINIQFSLDYPPQFWIFSLSLILTISLLAGAYPSFYLSSLNTISALKGKGSQNRSTSFFRISLVIIQFGVSTILILSAIVITKQIEIGINRQLGYDQNNLITITRNEEIDKNYDALKTELLQSNAVENVTVCNSSIAYIDSNNYLGWPGKDENTEVFFTTTTTEYDYCKTMGIKILMGRDFSRNHKSDTAAIIINKAALDLMNLRNPIGTQLELWGEKRELIGVVDNVLMGSVFSEVGPQFIIMRDWSGVVTLRLQGETSTSLHTVEEIFKKHNPSYPFEYHFVDLDFQKKFESIKTTFQLSKIFMIVAIALTSLGLIGLTSYVAEKRTVEFAIRKVLGASVRELILLITKSFLFQAAISFVLAAPIGYYILYKFLERYPIKTELSWWMFILVGAILSAFTILIVGLQSFRAATMNPTQSLQKD